MNCRLIVIVGCVGALVGMREVARADAAEAAAAATDLAIGAINQTRRAIVIGPHVGGLGAVSLDGDAHGAVTFGLALYTFKIPTVFELREVIVQAIRHRVEARIKAIIAAGGVPPHGEAELAALAREVAEEVKAEVVGGARARRLLERPRWGVEVEGAVRFGGGFQARAVVSRGVGKLSLGLAGAIERAGGRTTPLVGLEASLRLTPFGRAWTPVAEPYLRAEVGFDDGDHDVSTTLGARVVLDLL